MARRLLVTGAYGFIGRHVSRRFANLGWRVVGVGHGSWSREQWRDWGLEEWHATDVTLESLVTYAGEPDLIVHCAGGGSVGFSVTHPYQDFQRTTLTAISTLEYVRVHAPGASVVLLSSAAVYGLAATLPTAENESLNPISPYGVHKRLAEEICMSYAARYSMAVALVRFFSVYGLGLRKQLLWDACGKLRRGESLFGGTGQERRDWLHVEDAVELVTVTANRASPACPVVNGGSGACATVRAVLERLAAAFPSAGPVEFTGSVRAGDPTDFEADINLALSWGWTPRKALDVGIDEYVEWFKAGAP